MTIKGASILITGGSGSFGRAFTRHCLTADAARVRVFSRGEKAQAAMIEQFKDPREFEGTDPRLGFFIGDVRDRERLRRAMQGVDIVIHAAALKRIEVGHYNPIEMVRTNIDGAINVVEAAIDAHVERVVALSTDKAYQPVSAYGYSKAMAECIFRRAYTASTRFAVIRYGNVAGSDGSVIPIWRALKEAGYFCAPVTDPDCTRFWMTMTEAVALVDHTCSNMIGGELIIPELPAYRVGTLATAMGLEAFPITGLPAWEKKHECMGPGKCSDTAHHMTRAELQEALQHV